MADNHDQQKTSKKPAKEDISTEVEFSELIMGLSSAALHYMGHMSLQNRPESAINLPLAKQNINIISLLKEKTRGNLSSDEGNLIDSILADLRLKFVETSEKHKK